MDNPESPKKFVTAGKVAERFTCSKSGIYKLAAEGQIPCVKIGGAVRFDLEEVTKALHRPATK